MARTLMRHPTVITVGLKSGMDRGDIRIKESELATVGRKLEAAWAEVYDTRLGEKASSPDRVSIRRMCRATSNQTSSGRSLAS